MSESRGMNIVKASDGSILVRARLTDSSGAKITTGTASLYVLRFIPDTGALSTFDWDDNTFKTGAVTTPTSTLSHRTANNGSLDTGIWDKRIVSPALTAFSVGDKYVAYITHTDLLEDLAVEFQYGAGEGDDTPQTGDNYARIGASGAGLTSVGLAASAIGTSSFAAGALTDAIVGADFFKSLFNYRRGVDFPETVKHSIAGLLAALMTWSISGTTLTAKKVDGSSFFTQPLSSSSGAAPVVARD